MAGITSKFINIDYDKIYTNRKGDQYKIVEELPRKMYNNGSCARRVKVKFIKTGFEYDVSLQTAVNSQAFDHTEQYNLYGEEYFKLKGTLNNVDRKILDVLYRIIDRCYNPKNSSYGSYGGAGVRVCDEWRNNPKQFIEDFKHLPGYEDWLNSIDGENCKYHIDKDLLQPNVPTNQKVYSKNTCTILPNQLNSRISIKSKINKYIGVTKNGAHNTWNASIANDRIKYNLGNYSSELAAVNIYNYVSYFIPNSVSNDLSYDEQMTVEEAIQYLTSHSVTIPYGVQFPEFVNGKRIKIIYDGSEYFGVKRTNTNYYKAYAINVYNHETFIGEYNSEIAAANAVNLYYKKNKMHIPNQLPDDQIMDSKQVEQHRMMNQDEIIQLQQRKRLEIRLKYRYTIGETYTDDFGRKYTVLHRPKIDDIHTRHFKVVVQYLDTGKVKALSSSTLERQRSNMYDENHPRIDIYDEKSPDSIVSDRVIKSKRKYKKVDKDYFKPSFYGVGYMGEIQKTKTKKERCVVTLWRYMFSKISKNGKYPNKLLEYLDPRWHNFSNFLTDIETLDGYDKLIQSDFSSGFTIENKTKQLNIEPCERKWSKDTCTIVDIDSMSRLAAIERNKTLSKNRTMGIHVLKNVKNEPRYVTKITVYESGKVINVGTFDSEFAARAACDWYNELYNGVSYNGIGTTLRPQIWQKHKSGMKLMYRLIDKGEPERPTFYRLTNEDFETRRQRCLKIYGIDIAEDGY